MTPTAASHAPLFGRAAATFHTSASAHPESPALPPHPAPPLSGSTSRRLRSLRSNPAAIPRPPSSDSQTGSSPHPQWTNAPNCAHAAPSRSLLARRCIRKTQSPARPRNSIPASRVARPARPPVATPNSISVRAQSKGAKSLPGDDSPPVDKTRFRPICFAPPESKALFETPQNFPAAAACRGILSSRTAHLPASAESIGPCRHIPSVASSVLPAAQSFSPLRRSLSRRSPPQSQLL